MLFVPGSDQKKLDKLGALAARAVLLDLEDGVAASAKATARAQVASCLEAHRGRAGLWVRVNSFDSDELYDDLHAVVTVGLEGINLPKVNSARELQLADWLIGELERRRGLEVGSVVLMATIETAQGVGRLAEIASASQRLRCLCFGAADYSRELGLDWPPPDAQLSPTVLMAKSRLVQVSRQFNLEPPHDGASAEFHDLERLRLETVQARALGFSGKHAIHPAQIPIIEEIFRPSAAQLGWAQAVLDAYELHARTNVGAFALNGQMVDAPVAARARQILAQAAQDKEAS